jgi:hypothetical protein
LLVTFDCAGVRPPLRRSTRASPLWHSRYLITDGVFGARRSIVQQVA